MSVDTTPKVWKVGGTGWISLTPTDDLTQDQRTNLGAMTAGGLRSHDLDDVTSISRVLAALLVAWSFGPLTRLRNTDDHVSPRIAWFEQKLSAMPATTVDDIKTAVATALPMMNQEIRGQDPRYQDETGNRRYGLPKPVTAEQLKAELITKGESVGGALEQGYRARASQLDDLIKLASVSSIGSRRAEMQRLERLAAEANDQHLRAGYLSRARALEDEAYLWP